jgi:tape measure domain-containing protein
MKMATIGTAIRLNDMMSTPIRNITNAMNMMLSSWNDLDDATSSGLDVRNIESIRSELNQATRALDQMGNEQQQFNRHVQNGSNAMDGLTDKILGAVSAYAGMQGLQKLVNLSDEFTQTTARLNMINDGTQNTDELFDKITASANRARASISQTADTVAKLSLNAGDAFDSNDETILFAENLNKLFAIAGTEQASIASASLQLTQALGSGVLRGEEFNAVFEAAPNIMQTVADYMNVPIGQLRQMAQDGQITADVVKNALLGATEEINTQFESMPMTWAQVWTGIMNELYYASIPLLNVINWLAQNWSILQPIVLGVAAALAVYLLVTKGVELATKAWSAAQTFLNNVMSLNPIFIIIMAVILLISLIYAIVAAYNKWTGATVSATGIVVGAFMTAVAFIWNLFLGILDLALSIINHMGNSWIAFANFFGNLFNDPIASIIHLFGDFADSILGVIENIAKALDKVFGSDLAAAVQGWRGGLDKMVETAANKHGNGSYEKVAEELNLSSESLGLSRWAYGDAWDYGYDLGAGLEDKVGGMFGSGLGEEFSVDKLAEGIGEVPAFEEIANNTGDIKDSVNITSENLKYLRDLAEQDAVNRFTTAEIRVEMTNNNNVSSNMDLDGVVDYMVTGVQEAMERAAEGVHN